MKESDLYTTIDDKQDITTYTIGVLDPATCQADFPALLTSMAKEGGGDYFATTSFSELKDAIAIILNKIQAINSAFASASLPISVNTQGTFLNQIFMGMFRPDPDGNPRWLGNLKQYQFATQTTPDKLCPTCSVLNPRLFLADKNGRSAISTTAGSGFIATDAVSFWTSQNLSALPDSAGGFWKNAPTDFQGVSGGFDLEDGNVVEKGGVSQQIRLENLNVDYTATPTGPRRLYTCIGTNCTTALPPSGNLLSSMPFATTNADLTDTVLGAAGPAVNVTAIVRNSTTATVTLAAATTPTITSGTPVLMSGSIYPQFKGVFAAASPITPTSFTFTVSTSPPASATGTYFAADPGALSQPITSLTRIDGTTARATAVGHLLTTGTTVTISGASIGYNTGSTAITWIDDDNFTYALTLGPTTPGGGGTASVPTPGKPVRSIESVANSGIVRTGTIGTTAPFKQNVTVRTTANHGFVAGEQVTISGATTGYDGTYPITGTGNACTGAGSPAGRYFCFDIDTTPSSATAAVPGSFSTSPVFSIISLTRTTNTCTGGTPSPDATVTARTSADHPFLTGNTVAINPVTSIAGESLYTGSKTITTIDNRTFTYTITTTPGCSDANPPSTLTAAVSGVDRDTLINWVRGRDSLGDEASPGGAINIRPSIHGEVLHSRPAVIAYATASPPDLDVVVFYGSNDGTFRAVNGNQTRAIGSVPPGGEIWSFIPSEFYTKLQRQVLNSPIVKLFNTGILTPPAQPKDYFFDGAIGIFQDETVSPSKAYIFISARRGGRIIYAIDVSDPSNPKYMWKRSSADTGFGELGQTWSQPKPARVKGYVDSSGDPKPVLIFGAGYSPTQDTEPPTADTMGRGIFVLDALDGNIVWSAGYSASGGTSCQGNPCQLSNMTYSIPADVTFVDRNPDGLIDRLYAADVGGNVWRVDLEPTAGNTPANWQVTKLAALGGSATDKRKIFFAPDVVTTKNFDIVLTGTGDREHPVKANNATNIVNRFYMLKDFNTDSDACPMVSGVPTCAAPIVDNTDPTWPGTTGNTGATLSDLFDATTTPYGGLLGGFFFQLVFTDPSAATPVERGEKVVNAPTTVGGRTFFGTNTPLTPTASVCAPNLGAARGYSFDVITGEHSFVLFRGGGLPPSPVTGLVTVDVDGTPTLIPFLIGGGSPEPCVGPDCTSALGGGKPPIPITPIRTRTYWYREHDK